MWVKEHTVDKFNMASYSKLPLLLATALFYDRSLIPPTLPPSSDEQKRTKIHGHRSMDWYEGIVIPIIPLWTRVSTNLAHYNVR
jgi:hypothetical protein